MAFESLLLGKDTRKSIMAGHYFRLLVLLKHRSRGDILDLVNQRIFPEETVFQPDV